MGLEQLNIAKLDGKSEIMEEFKSISQVKVSPILKVYLVALKILTDGDNSPQQKIR